MRHAKGLSESDFMESLRSYFLWHVSVPDDNPDSCWEWRYDDPFHSGYSVFKVGGRSFRAHRASLVLLRGVEIPVGMTVHHNCNNRRCVNPAHLEVMSMAENTMSEQSMTTARANALKTHCPQGHEYTPDNTIRKRRASRGGRIERICRECHKASRKRARARKSAP